MNKPYLLIAGHCYYPEAGTGDWVGRFETYKEAFDAVIKTPIEPERFKSGPRKGQIKPEKDQPRIRETYSINGRMVDWYEIINLETWDR